MGSIPAMIRALGMGWLAFGSGTPFSVAKSALLKLSLLEGEAQRALAHRNAARMLRLSEATMG